MVAIVLTVPLLWGFMLWLLASLEEHTLAPAERAAKISTMLAERDPDEIERQVAELLIPSAGRR